MGIFTWSLHPRILLTLNGKKNTPFSQIFLMTKRRHLLQVAKKNGTWPPFLQFSISWPVSHIDQISVVYRGVVDIGGWLRCRAGCSIRWRLPLVPSVNAWEISHRVPAGRSVLDSLGVMDIQLHVNSSFVLLFCFCFKPPWEILLNCFIVTVRVLLQIKVHCVHCGARNDVPLPERSLF